MNITTETAAKTEELKYKPHTRLTAAFFVNSVVFDGEKQSVSVGLTVDSIQPARLEGDGQAVAVAANQRADGLLLKRKVHNLNTHARVVSQTFVPFANVRSLQYGD